MNLILAVPNLYTSAWMYLKEPNQNGEPISQTRSIHSGLETSNINLDTEFKNYRPISILSLVSKIIEKVVQIQLTDHFNRQSLIPTLLNAYRKFYSTETAILDLCDNILINMENNENTAIVTLDLSAAFDTVNHKILIKVLANYFSICEKELNWIMS